MMARLVRVVAVLCALATQGTAQTVSSSGEAQIRLLDKIDGRTTDLDMRVNETVVAGRLSITLGDCRYPVDNPAGDAFAWLTITAQDQADPIFQGWMIASAPALNALDHPRYDVWVIRCITP